MGLQARLLVVLAIGLASCASSLESHVRDLRDEDAGVRRDAAEAIGRLSAEAAPAVPALIEALGDEDALVRWNAAHALGKIGPTAEAAVPALVSRLADESLSVRQASIWALRKIGSGLPVSSLVTMLRTGEPGLRWNAAVTLGKLRSSAVTALPALRDALRDPDAQVRIAAEEAIRRIEAAPQN